MKKYALAAFFLLQPLFAITSWAVPCVSAPLTSYLTSGFSCNVGSLAFSDFLLVEQPTGSLPFPALVVNPVTSAPNEFGLEFNVSQTASAGQLFEQLIGYRVSGIGATAIDRNTLFFTGSSTTDDASVTALEQKCLAGQFTGVVLCTGTPLNLAVINIFDTPDPPISADFSPVGFLSVVSDIAVDGGTGGTGALTSATNLFRATAAVTPPPTTSVDEPSSIALAAIALLLMCSKRRKNH